MESRLLPSGWSIQNFKLLTAQEDLCSPDSADCCELPIPDRTVGNPLPETHVEFFSSDRSNTNPIDQMIESPCSISIVRHTAEDAVPRLQRDC